MYSILYRWISDRNTYKSIVASGDTQMLSFGPKTMCNTTLDIIKQLAGECDGRWCRNKCKAIVVALSGILL